MINDTEEGPKDAVKAIRKRLLQNAGKNHKVIMYTLTVSIIINLFINSITLHIFLRLILWLDLFVTHTSYFHVNLYFICPSLLWSVYISPSLYIHFHNNTAFESCLLITCPHNINLFSLVFSTFDATSTLLLVYECLIINFLITQNK